MRLSRNPTIDNWAQRFLKDGWSVRRGGRHYRLQSPDGKIRLTVPGSPSDFRAAENWRSQVRRSTGIDPAAQ